MHRRVHDALEEARLFLEERGLFERILRRLEEALEREHHYERATHGRFAGAYYRNPKTGEITVGDQTVPGSTAVTAPLIFTSSTKGVVPGPQGTLSVDNPAVTDARFSADFQSVNVTTPPTGAVTITWSDPAGKIASFSVTLTDQVVETVTGAFGTFAPGTTV